MLQTSTPQNAICQHHFSQWNFWEAGAAVLYNHQYQLYLYSSDWKLPNIFELETVEEIVLVPMDFIPIFALIWFLCTYQNSSHEELSKIFDIIISGSLIDDNEKYISLKVRKWVSVKGFWVSWHFQLSALGVFVIINKSSTFKSIEQAQKNLLEFQVEIDL